MTFLAHANQTRQFIFVIISRKKEFIFIDVLIPLVIQGLRNCFLLREDIGLSGANLFVKLFIFL